MDPEEARDLLGKFDVVLFLGGGGGKEGLKMVQMQVIHPSSHRLSHHHPIAHLHLPSLPLVPYAHFIKQTPIHHRHLNPSRPLVVLNPALVTHNNVDHHLDLHSPRKIAVLSVKNQRGVVEVVVVNLTMHLLHLSDPHLARLPIVIYVIAVAIFHRSRYLLIQTSYPPVQVLLDQSW